MAQAVDIHSLKPIGYHVPAVSSKLKFTDLMGALRMRLGIGRDNYTVTPGLYKTGNPGSHSDVLVSANYKLSFDMLRKNLNSLDVWILVIDTKGINVWCAAGKGTFDTDNVVKSIKGSPLEDLVKHRTILLPQLSASSVSAFKVKEQTGFRVIFGPVRAKDIRPFIEAGNKATPAMRKITFPLKERAKLIPVDFLYNKFRILVLLGAVFFFSGLDHTGFLFSKMMDKGFAPLINILGAYVAGIVIAPLLLPWIPFRAFSLKGAFWGLLASFIFYWLFNEPFLEAIALGFINISVASFMTMNFTGSSTYTSISGVQKEMKWSIPFQIGFLVTGSVLFIISRIV